MRPLQFTPAVRRCALAALMLLGASGGAQAGIVGEFTNASFIWTNKYTYAGPAVNVTLQSNGVTVSDGTAGLNQGGAFIWKGTDTPGSGTYNQANQTFTFNPSGPAFSVSGLITFCVEINQNISPGWSETYLISTDLAAAPTGTGIPSQSGMGAAAAGYIADLWNKYYNAATNSPSGQTINAHLYSQSDLSGAFQLAIWKLEYDTATAGTTGALKFSGNEITGVSWTKGNLLVTGNQAELDLAAHFLTDLVPSSNDGLRVLISGDHNGDFQDQLFAVPEPASLAVWLVVGSVGGWAGVFRRRRRGSCDG